MNVHAIQQVFGAVDGVVVLYVGVRVAATVVDILNRGELEIGRFKRSRQAGRSGKRLLVVSRSGLSVPIGHWSKSRGLFF